MPEIVEKHFYSFSYYRMFLMALILAILLIKPLGFSNVFLLHFLYDFFAISSLKASLVLMRKKVETN